MIDICGNEVYEKKKTTGYIWSDIKLNEFFLQVINMKATMDKILDYKTKWNLVDRMLRYKFLKIMNYIPKGREDRGRPLKELRRYSESGIL